MDEAGKSDTGFFHQKRRSGFSRELLGGLSVDHEKARG
jgi:hypothetical protein